jgi:hypothetical protein
MTLIDRIREKASEELRALQRRAEEEGWEIERVEREKQRFELNSEVTLCCEPGCLNMAVPLPGFREVQCSACRGE